ncbi:MAG: MotA/TolQ/ExbB proton channel family protein [Andreesenia angusta]|nr:MotA/TolQ/ExbB proton channel family protein [Andreesenia angusta]
MGQNIKGILHAVGQSIENPVILILIIMIAFTIVQIGVIISEFFTERRHLKASMPKLLDKIQKEPENIIKSIRSSHILSRQKKVLIELLNHPDLTDDTLYALAERLLEEESSHYNLRVKSSDIIAKLGPILGLLGTLIPLGPGIVALSRGDVTTLSTSLSVAFDTTIAGLICAAVAYIISIIRKGWYSNYMSVLEVLTEGVLEVAILEKK